MAASRAVNARTVANQLAVNVSRRLGLVKSDFTPVWLIFACPPAKSVTFLRLFAGWQQWLVADRGLLGVIGARVLTYNGGIQPFLS